MIQSFLDEFGAGQKKQVTPPELNTVLRKSEPGEILANKGQSKYWSGIGKMMHVMKWSRPDIYNATCNCARHMTLAGKTHYNAMICIMDYFITTPERGLLLKPFGNWGGLSTGYKFEVTVKTDSDYPK